MVVLRSTADSLGGWLQFVLIMMVMLVDAVCHEAKILGAELMMFVRWSRDVLRYNVRWAAQEKLRLWWRR
jgi:hypothetical protein